MTAILCWTCRQPATHTLTRDGSGTLHACDNCTRIDRPEAERRGWTITRIDRAATATHEPSPDGAKKCGPKTIPLYDCGGLAYLYCRKTAGHDGPHTP